jgi:hypothetical protein
MKLTLVDKNANEEITEVADKDHAVTLLQAARHWIGALLLNDDGTYVDLFVRNIEVPQKCPYLENTSIEAILEDRKLTRTGTPGTRLGRNFPGYCSEISSAISKNYGFAIATGSYMARDLKTLISVHSWNVLPDLSILDMTSDQFLDGANYRIVQKGHPDWLRYQPDFEDWEEILKSGRGKFSKRFLDYVEHQGKNVNNTPHFDDLCYLLVPDANDAVKKSLAPIVEEFLSAELISHQLATGRRKDYESDSPAP